MSDDINKPLFSPRLSETATLNPTDARMEVAPLSRSSQGLTDINRNMNGTGNPTTGHFMGDALEWLKRATTPHSEGVLLPVSSLFSDLSFFPPGSLFFFVYCRSPPTLCDRRLVSSLNAPFVCYLFT